MGGIFFMTSTFDIDEVYKSVDNVFGEELIHLKIVDKLKNKFEHIMLGSKLTEDTKEILKKFNHSLTEDDFKKLQDKLDEFVASSKSNEEAVDRCIGYSRKDVWKHLYCRLEDNDILEAQGSYVKVPARVIRYMVEQYQYMYGWRPSDIILHLIYDGYLMYEYDGTFMVRKVDA